MKLFLSIIFCLSALSFAAENASKGAKSPMVVGIVEASQDDHVLVVTRDKFKRKLLFNEQSKIIYIGYDEEVKEIKAKCGIRAQVKDEVISTIYVTQDIGVDQPEPTPEMVKMTSHELFAVADLNKNGKISYVEVSKTIKYSLKHGPITFSKVDLDKSGSLNQGEFEAFLAKTKWWKMSRKSPQEWLDSADQDKNMLLSKEELAILLGSTAHIEIFFRRADSNKSGDIDLNEIAAFIDTLIYPSLKKQR
ncbi:hypothetical protein LNTAR_07044 [Lentisphaera araneosa HTCC2155]|uniref:EF-hand domain-containing protein n=1 Tax=Lentisphaera araneosa HTCC2155 TaxID=313628 RepID=A6DMU4_9BACT|nr:EF-hand domain-containing protein [Lentisphaera araneosa]EDM26980.1 hypothetical protein LNTAR_07044 [Lentisphaera araneosa HTCC2155]